MKRTIVNVAASKRERLLNRARARQEPFDLVVRRFFFERFLFRLQMSPVSDRFVLKGAMLFHLWSGHVYRPTADLDLLWSGRGDAGALIADLATILAVQVEPDEGVRFDPASIVSSAIRQEDEYAGTRLRRPSSSRTREKRSSRRSSRRWSPSECATAG